MKYESNECCDCAVPGYPCLGDACSLRHVIMWRCNKCGCDELPAESMYDDDFCLECAEEMGLIDDEDD